MLFTAKTNDAATALDWGLISAMVEPEDVMSSAMDMARDIARQPPHALRLSKSLLRQGQSASYDSIMEMSAAMQAISHLTEDHMAGVEAIIERRDAIFHGR